MISVRWWVKVIKDLSILHKSIISIFFLVESLNTKVISIVTVGIAAILYVTLSASCVVVTYFTVDQSGALTHLHSPDPWWIIVRRAHFQSGSQHEPDHHYLAFNKLSMSFPLHFLCWSWLSVFWQNVSTPETRHTAIFTLTFCFFIWCSHFGIWATTWKNNRLISQSSVLF